MRAALFRSAGKRTLQVSVVPTSSRCVRALPSPPVRRTRDKYAASSSCDGTARCRHSELRGIIRSYIAAAVSGAAALPLPLHASTVLVPAPAPNGLLFARPPRGARQYLYIKALSLSLSRVLPRNVDPSSSTTATPRYSHRTAVCDPPAKACHIASTDPQQLARV